MYSHSLLFASLLQDNRKQTNRDGSNYNNNSLTLTKLLESCKCTNYHSEKDSEEDTLIFSKPTSFYLHVLLAANDS